MAEVTWYRELGSSTEATSTSTAGTSTGTVPGNMLLVERGKISTSAGCGFCVWGTWGCLCFIQLLRRSLWMWLFILSLEVTHTTG